MTDLDGITPYVIQATDYINNHWALVLIEEGTKGPTTKGWQMFDQCITKVEQINGHTGGLGLAHAYSGTMAIDSP